MEQTPAVRLQNLLAAVVLGLYDDGTAALETASGLTGSGPAALLALEEFLDGATVGRLSEVLGLTHSGAVRLVKLLEEAGLASRHAGRDRRTVEVRLTDRGRERARAARAARLAVLGESVEALDRATAEALEAALEEVVTARVRARVARRATGESGPWWCRTCDFTACGRPEGRCPAQTAATSQRT